MKQSEYLHSPEHLARLKAYAIRNRKSPTQMCRVGKEAYARVRETFPNRYDRRTFIDDAIMTALDKWDAEHPKAGK